MKTMQPRLYEAEGTDWRPVRPEVTRGVVGASLVPEGWGGDVKAVLTRVAPGGEFATHVDAYHHVFYFLEGEGEGWIGEERYAIRPGLVAEVPAGLPHGYRNTANSDLLLLTLNLPGKE